jgi:hypothetical protein
MSLGRVQFPKRAVLEKFLISLLKFTENTKQTTIFVSRTPSSLSNFGQLSKSTHSYFAGTEMNQRDYPPLKFLWHLEVTRLWKKLFPQATNIGGSPNRL